MRLSDRYKNILEYFASHKPDAQTELTYNDPFQLIVAVILSAQCTDKRVNLITPGLFEMFPDPESMSAADIDAIFDMIKSCSYPNNKARHLKGMATVLMNEFNGIVPSDTNLLQKLPGVGRKTANVIASVVWNKPVIAVDTHVYRVSKRLGLTPDAKTPLDAELTLTENIPDSQRALAHHWLLLHGRYVCTARNPHCIECEIKQWCEYYSANNKNV